MRIPDDLYDEDFQTAVLEHKRRYSQLRDSGLLDAHAAIRRAALNAVIENVAAKMPAKRDLVYVLGVRYDADTFAHVRCESRFEEVRSIWPAPPKDDSWRFYEDIPDVSGVLSAVPGYIEVYLVPGRSSYQRYEKDKFIDTVGPWSERIVGVAEIVAGHLCRALLALRFPE